MVKISITRDLKRTFKKRILTLTCRGLKGLQPPKWGYGATRKELLNIHLSYKDIHTQ